MIIVNFSTSHYARGQQRLARSLAGQRMLMLDDYAAIGSPTHQESPYEFKVHAINKACELDPVVLWCDSSMYRVGDLSKIESIIKNDGYFMEEAGHYVGRWTNNHTRKYFNLTEEESKQCPGGFLMFSAGLLGLNFNFTNTRIWFNEWHKSALAGCFRGSWDDHRHDMTCGSIIAQRMGLKYQRGASHMAYIGPGYSTPEASVVFYCQGI